MDQHALQAWTAQILRRAQKDPLAVAYKPGTVTFEFMQSLAHLSIEADGPLKAREFLAKHGIALVIEPHLPRTLLDGAALMSPSGTPVIGLTLRYDRIDNFWFCLMHELAHLARHLDGEDTQFYDDLETGAQADPREVEADALAGEALIPEAAWRQSSVRVFPSPETAQELAVQLGIHPAIVAGHVQHERKNFKLLHHMVGRDEVRSLFWGVSRE
jgi:HTH-type transcriptional regulator/antitoxin HigA